MTHTIRVATADEADDVARLIALAYRVEDFFVDGDRTNPQEVRELMTRGVFLLAEDPPETLAGAVYVTIEGDHGSASLHAPQAAAHAPLGTGGAGARGFFAMLSVHPAYQRRGLGVRLVAAAEDYCRDAGCRHMDLHVVNLRTELPPFYRRLGYVEQGTAPFPPGSVTKMPCHVIVMTKPLDARQRDE